MITTDDLKRGIELQTHITVLEVLLNEKRGTPMDAVRRSIFPDKFENIEISVLEILLGEKKAALKELKEKCQKP